MTTDQPAPTVADEHETASGAGLSEACAELEAIASILERPPLTDVRVEESVAASMVQCIRLVVPVALAASRTSAATGWEELEVDLRRLAAEWAERERQRSVAGDMHGRERCARAVEAYTHAADLALNAIARRRLAGEQTTGGAGLEAEDDADQVAEIAGCILAGSVNVESAFPLASAIFNELRAYFAHPAPAPSAPGTGGGTTQAIPHGEPVPFLRLGPTTLRERRAAALRDGETNGNGDWRCDPEEHIRAALEAIDSLDAFDARRAEPAAPAPGGGGERASLTSPYRRWATARGTDAPAGDLLAFKAGLEAARAPIPDAPAEPGQGGEGAGELRLLLAALAMIRDGVLDAAITPDEAKGFAEAVDAALSTPPADAALREALEAINAERLNIKMAVKVGYPERLEAVTEALDAGRAALAPSAPRSPAGGAAEVEG